MIFKISDKVRINPKSQYYGVQPIGCSSKDAVGTIKEIQSAAYIKVEWYKLGSGKYANTYAEQDLILATDKIKLSDTEKLRTFYTAGKIKVGTELEIDGIKGIVGEIIESGSIFNGIYLFHDNENYKGSKGKVSPDSMGYRFSAQFSPSNTVTLVSAPKVNKEKSVELTIFRKGGRTYLEFNIPQLLEDIFKAKSKKEVESKNWPGLSFYTMAQTDSVDYKRLLSQFNLFDNYGDEFVREGKYNIAFIRTVGGKGAVAINDDLTLAEVSMITSNMLDFLKKWYQEFVRDYKVSAIVQLEIK